MIIHPWEAALDTAEWQDLLKTTDESSANAPCLARRSLTLAATGDCRSYIISLRRKARSPINRRASRRSIQKGHFVFGGLVRRWCDPSILRDETHTNPSSPITAPDGTLVGDRCVTPYLHGTILSVLIRPAAPQDLPALPGIESAAGAAFADIGMVEIANDNDPTVEELSRYQMAGRAWVAVDEANHPVAYLIADVVDGCLHIEQVSVHSHGAHRTITITLTISSRSPSSRTQ